MPLRLVAGVRHIPLTSARLARSFSQSPALASAAAAARKRPVASRNRYGRQQKKDDRPSLLNAAPLAGNLMTEEAIKSLYPNVVISPRVLQQPKDCLITYCLRVSGKRPITSFSNVTHAGKVYWR